MAMTIRDIAELAGVSHTTVSRVLNENKNVSEKTKKKIEAIIKQHNYIPNDSARNLKLIDTKSIGVFANNINNPFLSKMVQLIESELQKYDYSIYLHILSKNEDFVLTVSKQIKAKKLNGLIFIGGSSSFTENDFENFSVPIVFTTIKPITKEKEKYSSIYIDDKKAAFLATEYLINLGHKKIAIITSGKTKKSIGQDRLFGYLKALEENGIEKNPSLIKQTLDSSDIEAAYKQTIELIENQKEFTAIFAITDVFAFGAIRALQDKGFNVPKDISVIGFDGIELGNFTVPRLTSVQQPMFDMVTKSVETMIEMIEKSNHGVDLVFPTKIIERESCLSII